MRLLPQGMRHCKVNHRWQPNGFASGPNIERKEIAEKRQSLETLAARGKIARRRAGD
ncbi:hypothetical protein [Pelagibius marinus]|uniref:hypothetical protein n=1 Tax=Pelagibius marinus TaxID=2762760 RepID=UPI001872C02B|nr:hypothetical protein [Pelagibius marinus]